MSGRRDRTFRELIDDALIGSTHEQAAQQLGVVQSTVTGWRKGQIPRPTLVPAIAEWLDVSEDDVWASIVFQQRRPSPEENLAHLQRQIDELTKNYNDLLAVTDELAAQNRELGALVRRHHGTDPESEEPPG